LVDAFRLPESASEEVPEAGRDREEWNCSPDGGRSRGLERSVAAYADQE